MQPKQLVISVAALLMAACAQVQPSVAPLNKAAEPVLPTSSVAVLDAGVTQAIVRVGTDVEKRGIKAVVNISAPKFSLKDVPTVHHWEAADIVEYVVTLMYTTDGGTTFQPVNPGVTAVLAASGPNATSQAAFENLAAGGYYRVKVEAYGRKDGATGTGELVHLNASSGALDYGDFDFYSNTQDIGQVRTANVTIHFDDVLFSGAASLTIDKPATQGAYYDAGVPRGTQNYQLDTKPTGYFPLDIARDITSGNMWVTHSNNPNEITKLSSDGEFLATYSLGLPSLFASGASDIVDHHGNVWVNLGDHALVKLDSTGSVLFAAPYTNLMYYMAVDNQDNLWVGDNVNKAVWKLGSSNGLPMGSYTIDAYPAGVVVDDQENVWVAGLNDGRLYKLSTDGTVLGSYSTGLSNAVALAVDHNTDNVWVSGINDFVATTVYKLSQVDTSGTLLTSYYFSGNETTASAQNLARFGSRLAVSPQGNVWVSGYYYHGIVLSSVGKPLMPIGPSQSVFVFDDRHHAWCVNMFMGSAYKFLDWVLPDIQVG